MKKVTEARVLEMTKKLCEKLLNGKEQNRDVAGIALKTIVSETTNPKAVEGVLVTLTPQLIKGITVNVSTSNQ